MRIIIALTLFIIFLAIAVIHIYWAFDGKWGSKSVIPVKSDDTKVIMPGVLPTLAVAAGLLAFSLLVIVKGGLWSVALPAWLERYGLYIIAGIFIIRAVGDFRYVGFFKTYRQTTFGKNDTRLYSPLCLGIGILAILLSYSG